MIVGCSQAHEQALEVISAASAQRADRPVVVLYHGSPNGFLERAFEAGADDLVGRCPQAPGQLGFALEKALARRRGAVASATAGAMITVLGPKGGTGKTVTSSNLAVALALEGHSSVLVDLDLQFGDVGLALGLQPTKTIYDLATSGGTLDGDKVDSFLAQHSSGARALLAPLRPDQAAAIDTAFLREVFEILRARYDFVLVDTPPAFSPEVIAAVDASSHLCMVGMLDALSLKDTKIGLETLAEMGYDPRSITLVLNRADSSVGDHRESTSSGCSAERRTCSSAATARSRAHSRTASRSWSPSRGRRRPGRTPRWRSGTWRFRCSRWPRPTTTGGGGCCCGRRARRWNCTSGSRARRSSRRWSAKNGNGTTTDPFAELKNRIHLALVSELGPRLFDVEDSGAVRARVESEIGEQLSQEAGAVS